MKKCLVVGMALLLSACAMESGKMGADQGAAGLPLIGTNWALSKVGETPVTLAAGQREPFLTLQASDGHANGFAGCNMFAGPYQLSGRKLSFGPLMMTRMACPALSLEGGYATALREAKGYKISGSQLALTDEAGKVLATFVAKPAATN